MKSIHFVVVASIALAGISAKIWAFEPDGNMPRSAVPEQYKWKLTPLFADDAAFTAALAGAPATMKRLTSCKGTLKNPKHLRTCLALYFDFRQALNKMTLYSSMRFDSDTSSDSLQAMSDHALKAFNDMMTDTTFFREEILALNDGTLAAAYRAEPGLKTYKPYIDEFRRRRAHVLPAQGEKVLALAGDNLWAEIDLNELPSDHEKTFNALSSDMPLPSIKDAEGKKVQLTLSNYGQLRSSKDRRVREEAVEGLFGTLRQYQHVYAGTFAGQLNLNVFLARARGYKTALDAYLDKDEIDPAVYRNLIRTIHANLQPLHDYIQLRKRAMGLKELHIYDLYPPMVKGASTVYPYETALKILPEALAPLGKEYVGMLSRGLDPAQGWVDVYPNKNKKSGAFSSSVFGVHPFVKVNYYDETDDLSALAHEFGHAMHSQLAMEHQSVVTYNYKAFIAEIASTLNEKLVSDYLLAHVKTDAERLSILNELVEKIRTTIYRQTLFAEFELEAHTAAEKGTPITAEFLNGLYGKLIRTYYGPGFTVGANDEMEWAYIPHFYYKYYVFSYATGLSSALALANRIQKNGEAGRQAYLTMLKGGSSKPPLTLLKNAGVDLTKPDAIEAATRLMQQCLKQMNEILDRNPELAERG